MVCDRNINDYELEMEGSGDRCRHDEISVDAGLDEVASGNSGSHDQSSADTGFYHGATVDDEDGSCVDGRDMPSTVNFRAFEAQQLRKDAEAADARISYTDVVNGYRKK